MVTQILDLMGDNAVTVNVPIRFRWDGTTIREGSVGELQVALVGNPLVRLERRQAIELRDWLNEHIA